MLADSSRPAGPLSSLCRGWVVAASPGTWPPCLQQCTGLPMLGSEHSSWGCFLPAEHVLSLSICCPVSPDTALGLSSQNRDACVGRKEGCLLEPISDLEKGCSGLGAPGSYPHEQCSLRKREENERPKGPSCIRLFRQDLSFSILQGQHHCPLHSFSKYLLSNHHVTRMVQATGYGCEQDRPAFMVQIWKLRQRSETQRSDVMDPRSEFLAGRAKISGYVFVVTELCFFHHLCSSQIRGTNEACLPRILALRRKALPVFSPGLCIPL